MKLKVLGLSFGESASESGTNKNPFVTMVVAQLVEL